MQNKELGVDARNIDEFGQIKDEGRWDFKQSLISIEKDLKAKKLLPTLDFSSEIRQFIDHSFTSGEPSPRGITHGVGLELPKIKHAKEYATRNDRRSMQPKREKQ